MKTHLIICCPNSLNFRVPLGNQISSKVQLRVHLIHLQTHFILEFNFQFSQYFFWGELTLQKSQTCASDKWPRPEFQLMTTKGCCSIAASLASNFFVLKCNACKQKAGSSPKKETVHYGAFTLLQFCFTLPSPNISN